MHQGELTARRLVITFVPTTGRKHTGERPPSSRYEELDRGVAHGELDPNVDPEVALDLIFGPTMYRKAIGHAGLRPADGDAIVATAMRALAS